MRRADTRDISLRTAAVHLRFIFYHTVEVRGEAGCRVKFHEFRPRRNAPRGLPPPATYPAVGRLGTGPRGAPRWRHAAGTAGDTAGSMTSPPGSSPGGCRGHTNVAAEAHTSYPVGAAACEPPGLPGTEPTARRLAGSVTRAVPARTSRTPTRAC